MRLPAIVEGRDGRYALDLGNFYEVYCLKIEMTLMMTLWCSEAEEGKKVALLYQEVTPVTAAIISGFTLLDPSDEERQLADQIVETVFNEKNEMCYLHCEQRGGRGIEGQQLKSVLLACEKAAADIRSHLARVEY